jgi:S1-C subfamily serine protease
MFHLFLLVVVLASQVADKPRERSNAETKAENIARYQLGGFELDSNGTIGADLKYAEVDPQGVSIVRFDADSPSQASGLKLYDTILEVNGSAVGKIRGRYYEPWKFYRRIGPHASPEFLVSFVEPNGSRAYYYPFVAVGGLSELLIPLPEDFFTTEQPRERTAPESAILNRARYKYGAGNFAKYARYRLGVNVQYSYDYGATITKVHPGGAAATAGLKVGDLIHEVGGAPVGVFNDRVYEIWRQFPYLRPNKVEFLVVYRDSPTKPWKYYYPIIELEVLGSPG